MILDMTLSSGTDWYGLISFQLTFQSVNKGYWTCLNPDWINLLAYETSGNFMTWGTGDKHVLGFYDGHNDDPAFTLTPAPTGEWDQNNTQGFIYVMNPRNQWGLHLNDDGGNSTWARRQ